MAAKVNQKQYFRTPPTNLRGVGLPGTKNASATLTTETQRTNGINCTTLTLTAQTISVLAAADYGSLLLFTMPASRCLFLGADVSLSSVKLGYADDTDNTDLDISVGSAAASNNTLSSTMVDLVAKVDATGTTVGTILVSATPTEAPKMKAASLAMYLNTGGALVTTGTGVLTLTGTVKILWMDVGSM